MIGGQSGRRTRWKRRRDQEEMKTIGEEREGRSSRLFLKLSMEEEEEGYDSLSIYLNHHVDGVKERSGGNWARAKRGRREGGNTGTD